MRRPGRGGRKQRIGNGDELAGALGANAPSPFERLCREWGLRWTDQRQAIARVLSEATDSPDAEEVHRRAMGFDPRVSLSTVYRTLSLFERVGILKRWSATSLEPRVGKQDGRRRGRSRCESTDGVPRHRLVDIETGATLVFQDAALDLLLAALAARLGFRIVDQRFELFGIREDMLAEATPAAMGVRVGERSRGGA